MGGLLVLVSLLVLLGSGGSRSSGRGRLLFEAHLNAIVLLVVLLEGGGINLDDGALHQSLRPHLLNAQTFAQQSQKLFVTMQPHEKVEKFRSTALLRSARKFLQCHLERREQDEHHGPPHQLVIGGIVHDIQDTGLPGDSLHHKIRIPFVLEEIASILLDPKVQHEKVHHDNRAGLITPIEDLVQASPQSPRRNCQSPGAEP